MSVIEPEIAAPAPDEAAVAPVEAPVAVDAATSPVGLTFKVVYNTWGADGEAYTGGIHTVEDPTPEFLALLAGAEAVGAVEVIDDHGHRATIDSHVQSQEDGEAANEAAVASGDWHIGNLQQFVVGTQARLAAADDPDQDAPLEDWERAKLTTDIADAQAQLAEREAQAEPTVGEG